MKAKLYFAEDPITGYGSIMQPKLEKLNESMKLKIHDKIIELPCIPTLKMKINLLSFKDIYKFSKKEVEYLEDCNWVFEIKSIVIEKECLELDLEY